MKFLYLLGSRLTLYFRKSRLLFLLFCFCAMASSLSFLFFYGTLPSVSSRNSREFYYRQFTVTDIFEGLRMEDLKMLQEDPMVENATLVHVGIEGVPVKLAASFGVDPGRVRVAGAESFAGADPYSIIVPFDPMSGRRVGESVTIDDKEFTVIGTCSGITDNTYIPLETYLTMGLSTESAVVYAKEKADADSGAMAAKLREVFGEEISISTGNADFINGANARMSTSMFRELSLTYGIVILVFLFLFLQMVAENGRETAIFRTFGATKAKVAAMHFCEVLLLTGGSATLGILLHALLYKPVFSKLHVADVVYYPSDYLLVLAVMLGVTAIVSIPYVIRALTLTPKEATLNAAE